MGKILRITARPEGGFRRCGIDHPPTPVDHPASKFSAEAIAKLKEEPQLVVQELEEEKDVGLIGSAIVNATLPQPPQAGPKPSGGGTKPSGGSKRSGGAKTGSKAAGAGDKPKGDDKPDPKPGDDAKDNGPDKS